MLSDIANMLNLEKVCGLTHWSAPIAGCACRFLSAENCLMRSDRDLMEKEFNEPEKLYSQRKAGGL